MLPRVKLLIQNYKYLLSIIHTTFATIQKLFHSPLCVYQCGDTEQDEEGRKQHIFADKFHGENENLGLLFLFTLQKYEVEA